MIKKILKKYPMRNKKNKKYEIWVYATIKNNYNFIKVYTKTSIIYFAKKTLLVCKIYVKNK